MKMLFISFLALAVCVTAEEATVVARKRGINSDIGYGNVQLPFGGLIELGQVGYGKYYGGIPLPSFSITTEYGQGLGHIPAYSSQTYAGFLAANVGAGHQSAINYPGGGQVSGLGSGIAFSSQPQVNGYYTSYGLGAYADEAYIQKQLSSGIASRIPQRFPIQDIKDLTAIGPQAISSNAGTAYGFKYTESSPLPLAPDYSAVISSIQSKSPLIQSPPDIPPTPIDSTSQIANTRPVSQPGIAFGSGSLGITQLSNGNYALGSGSIGYVGSLATAAATPSPQSSAPAQVGFSGYNSPDFLKGY